MERKVTPNYTVEFDELKRNVSSLRRHLHLTWAAIGISMTLAIAGGAANGLVGRVSELELLIQAHRKEIYADMGQIVIQRHIPQSRFSHSFDKDAEIWKSWNTGVSDEATTAIFTGNGNKIGDTAVWTAWVIMPKHLQQKIASVQNEKE